MKVEFRVAKPVRVCVKVISRIILNLQKAYIINVIALKTLNDVPDCLKRNKFSVAA